MSLETPLLGGHTLFRHGRSDLQCSSVISHPTPDQRGRIREGDGGKKKKNKKEERKTESVQIGEKTRRKVEVRGRPKRRGESDSLKRSVFLALKHNVHTKLQFMDMEPTQYPYTYLVLVSATDDVFFGDGQGVDAASSVALQHLGTLQTLQVPDLYIHKHTVHYILVLHSEAECA